MNKKRVMTLCSVICISVLALSFAALLYLYSHSEFGHNEESDWLELDPIRGYFPQELSSEQLTSVVNTIAGRYDYIDRSAQIQLLSNIGTMQSMFEYRTAYQFVVWLGSSSVYDDYTTMINNICRGANCEFERALIDYWSLHHEDDSDNFNNIIGRCILVRGARFRRAVETEGPYRTTLLQVHIERCGTNRESRESRDSPQ